ARPHDIATVFMTLLVVWDLAGGAFETTHRPLPVEGTIFAFGAIIAALVPLMRSHYRWVPLAATIVCGLHFAFAAFAVFAAPADEGFGRPGPAIAAVLLAGATVFALKASRGREWAR